MSGGDGGFVAHYEFVRASIAMAFWQWCCSYYGGQRTSYRLSAIELFESVVACYDRSCW
jgi:hypothetical protein